MSSSSLVSRSSGVSSSCWSLADGRFGSQIFCGIGGKEQEEAQCPFLQHLKQSPLAEQFSHSFEECFGIWGVEFIGVSGVISLVVQGVWEKFGHPFF